jgi:hypothetical protein
MSDRICITGYCIVDGFGIRLSTSNPAS